MNFYDSFNFMNSTKYYEFILMTRDDFGFVHFEFLRQKQIKAIIYELAHAITNLY